MGYFDGEINITAEKRLCRVGNKIGYFHGWYQYKNTSDEGTIGIVELPDETVEVFPSDILFMDDEHEYLKILNQNIRHSHN